MKRKLKLPLATYVILGLLIADTIYAYLITYLPPWPLRVIGVSYILMILSRRLGLILFVLMMVGLSMVIMIPQRADFNYGWELFSKVCYPILMVSIAMIIRKDGVSALKILWSSPLI